MSGHRTIPETEIAWRNNRDRARLEIRLIARRWENATLEKMDAAFNQHLNEGNIVEFGETDIINCIREAFEEAKDSRL